MIFKEKIQVSSRSEPSCAPLPDTPAAASAPAADVETASERYQQRFKGETGAWFLQEQARHLLALLDPWPGARILDVGGGHGQYTERLVQQGYDVTVLGSTPQAGEQVESLVASGQCRYRVGNLTDFPVTDNSYDIVISFRLMTHSEDWRRLVGETARVARHAVILDFPVIDSFNLLYPVLFWAKRIGEKNTTRTFRIFKTRDVVAEYGKTGFMPTACRRQFFFPMVLHRVLRVSTVSMKVETVCRRLGLTRIFGSPVILRLESTPRDQAPACGKDKEASVCPSSLP